MCRQTNKSSNRAACFTLGNVGRPIKKIALTPEEKVELRNRVRATTTLQRGGLRARIILEKVRGKKAEEIAR